MAARHRPHALRLERAAVHLEALQRDLAEYGERHPFRAAPLGTPHGLWQATLVERLPPHLPLVVGDAVHNLRAALDQAAKALVPPHLRKRTQFPLLREDVLARDPATGHYRLADNSARRARARWQAASEAVPGAARQFMESVQPYQQGQERLARQLALLGALQDADKQHELDPVVTGLAEPAATVPLGRLVLSQPFVLAQHHGNELVGFVAKAHSIPGELPRIEPRHAEQLERLTGRWRSGSAAEAEVWGVPRVAMEVPGCEELVPLPSALADLWDTVRAVVDVLDVHAEPATDGRSRGPDGARPA